jgi:cation:H+ antiporter
MAAIVPGIVIRITGGPSLLAAGLLGLAVVGASLLLTWGAEIAQLDLSPAVAIAGLALVAVLPEYVVGATFAFRGGRTGCRVLAGGDSPCHLALANMMGANRLLIGVGWSLVVLLAWWRTRTRRGQLLRGVVLGRRHAVELSFLAVASVWCLLLPFRHSVGLVDTAVLLLVFLLYGLRVLRAPAGEPELEGVAAQVGALAPPVRRAIVLAFLLGAGAVIFACANAFADALVASGSTLGVSDTFLVQWLAPLASEAPELTVAGIYAWRLRAPLGLSALVSSKVNQWTLLVGSLPIAFAVASGSLHGLPLDHSVRQELALTAAQSVFGVAVLGNMEVSTAEAISLFSLFAAELVIGTAVPGTRIGFSTLYLVAGVAVLVVKRRDTVTLVQDGFRTPYEELVVEPDPGRLD